MIWTIILFIGAIVLFILDITGKLSLMIRGTHIKAWVVVFILAVIFLIWDYFDRRKKKKGGKVKK